MIVKVYHDNNPAFGMGERSTTFPNGFKLVANVEVPEDAEGLNYINRLDLAFQLTNHIDYSWTENPDVTSKSNNVRSSSVGDVLKLQGKYYLLEMSGFTEITPKQQEFKILVSRTVSSTKSITVTACLVEEAEDMALEEALNVDFGTGDNPKYEVE